MALCTDFTVAQEKSDGFLIKPLPCKCWTCEHCNPRRKWQLMQDAARGEPDTFLTLTVNPNFLASPDQRARALVKTWRTVKRHAEKKYNYKKIPFFAVFEKTKKGEPHLHVLLRVKWLDQKWLSAEMSKLMEVPIVDIRRVRDEAQMVAYIAKYIGKDPHHFKGTKRYWRSLNWFLPGRHPEDDKTPQAGRTFFLPTKFSDLVNRYAHDQIKAGEQVKELFLSPLQMLEVEAWNEYDRWKRGFL